MSLHHNTPFALCVGEPNPSQQNVACLPLVMKDDLHGAHHSHLHEYQPKIPVTNVKSAWTDAATECLIDVFEEKWNSLRRGNLKAKNWDEVGAELAARCGVPKTGDQCRHKIEKLRGKYRSEKVSVNFGQSRWPWFDRLNMVFEDRSRQQQATQQQQAHQPQQQLKDSVEFDGSSIDKLHVEMRIPEVFQQQAGNVEEGGGSLPANQLQQELAYDQRDEKNERGDNTSYTSQKNNSGEEAGGCCSPKSRNGRSSKKRRREAPCCECGAAIKYLGETLLKIEERKLETQRETDKLKVEMESKRAEVQALELKRTEMLVQMELRRTEMFCELELKRTKIQMEMLETLCSSQGNLNVRPKRNT